MQGAGAGDNHVQAVSPSHRPEERDRMSLTGKLMGGFGAMLTLVLLLTGGTLLVTRDLNIDLDRAANVTARKQYLAGAVNAVSPE